VPHAARVCLTAGCRERPGVEEHLGAGAHAGGLSLEVAVHLEAEAHAGGLNLEAAVHLEAEAHAGGLSLEAAVHLEAEARAGGLSLEAAVHLGAGVHGVQTWRQAWVLLSQRAFPSEPGSAPQYCYPTTRKNVALPFHPPSARWPHLLRIGFRDCCWILLWSFAGDSSTNPALAGSESAHPALTFQKRHQESASPSFRTLLQALA
jgi:hypothetical protein